MSRPAGGTGGALDTMADNSLMIEVDWKAVVRLVESKGYLVIPADIMAKYADDFIRNNFPGLFGESVTK